MVNMHTQIDLLNHKEFLKYSKIETRSETSKSGDRSLAIPVELPENRFLSFNINELNVGIIKGVRD